EYVLSQCCNPIPGDEVLGYLDEDGMMHIHKVDCPEAALPKYQLRWRYAEPVSRRSKGKGTLYDFGRETFGHLEFLGCEGWGGAAIYYGESKEEALDKEHCETLDMMRISNGRPHSKLGSKAFRYVYIEDSGSVSYKLAMNEEYSPQDEARSGSFCCNDKELNSIWQVSARTLDLTTQEFFIDGIKRDRWTWSGDAIQSYLMNYYLRFDTECVKRTIRQLRGKDPVTAHVNTIMDYTFYWFVSIGQYYDFTADADFVKEMWPRMQTLMDYVLGRTNADGMAEGKSDDWIFVDWVDFPMHKRGTLCFEQQLLCKALQTMARCARIVGSGEADRYEHIAESLLERTRSLFWNEHEHAFMHAVEDGQINPQVTKFPNMMALLYGYAEGQQAEDIVRHVMLNPQVPAITTPYMRFYELEALCLAGMQTTVLSEMKAYWGGMLREDATTFWEKYNPEERGKQHLAMYGRPYGKSLCHAWGASPLYLLGRYFLGVRPTKPGYEEFEVCPSLGGLKWMKGDVPTPFGKIHVEASKEGITAKSDGGRGTLIVGSKRLEIKAGQEVTVR
ncbi:MAG: alpha-rhamnosidase, partial [Prevotella sp.]|nr:alpha-rhamnosidase [Prevotella sp.]